MDKTSEKAGLACQGYWERFFSRYPDAALQKRAPQMIWQKRRRSALAIVTVLLVAASATCALSVRAEAARTPAAAPGWPKRPSAWAVPMEKPGLPDLFKVSEALYRGAQPTAEGFQELKAMGTRTVINLCAAHSDRRAAQEAGLDYEEVPLTTYRADDKAINRVLTMVVDPMKAPFFVYDERGAEKTGTMVAIFQIVLDGRPVDDALKELTQGGYGVKAAPQDIAEYLHGLDIRKLKQEASALAASALPPEVIAAFHRLDQLGGDRIASAKYVELRLQRVQLDPDSQADRRVYDSYRKRRPELPEWGSKKWNAQNSQEITLHAYLLKEDKDSAVVLRDDLLPWTYRKDRFVQMPESWGPDTVKLLAVKDADFDAYCHKMEGPPRSEFPGMINGPGPAAYLLAAHAAWKKGRAEYVIPIMAAWRPEMNALMAPNSVGNTENYSGRTSEFLSTAFTDLAWRQYLRGVNLLMYADRRDVLTQLRLARQIAPRSEYAADADELIKRLEPLVAQETAAKARPQAPVDVARLSDQQKASLYVSQLKDLHCVQMAQPGDIMPYMGVLVGRTTSVLPTPDIPTVKLMALGNAAIPALIAALQDDTPTRTVYFWRDFAPDRTVWRVSDFAWNLLRDITGKEFGRQNMVGFTFSYMTPQKKREVIASVKKWYAQNKGLSEDQKMFRLLSSDKQAEWMRAGSYFADKGDERAVKPLLDKLSHVDSYRVGELCELIARFGDRSAIAPIRALMLDPARADNVARARAAIALLELGDESGLPVEIKDLNGEGNGFEMPYLAVWYLMRTHTPKGMAALRQAVIEDEGDREYELLDDIGRAAVGDPMATGPFESQPVGSADVCGVVMEAIDKEGATGASVDNVSMRLKDVAANVVVALRFGPGPDGSGYFGTMGTHPKVFDPSQPDKARRDAQIEALKHWYAGNKGRLAWDDKAHHLIVRRATQKPKRRRPGGSPGE